MTSQHTQDAFEIRFESAVTDMHQRTPRGNQPPASVWEAIHAGVRETRADAADPRAPGPDPAPVSRKTRRMRKESSMDMTLNPGMAAPQPQAGRGLFTWAAVALVGMLVISSLLWYGQIPPGNDGNELAWAPTTGTPESFIGVASPAASPQVYEYGPEYACNVAPLTSEQVFDIVMNPVREYERRMGEDRSDTGERLEEARINQFTHYEQGRMNREQYIPAEGNDSYAEIEQAANTFWNCLMTGTAFQMWSLMNPYAVQLEILMQYPVLRDEETLRTHIEEWGPRRYSANLYHAFPDLGNVDPLLATRMVTDSWDSIMITTDRQTGQVTSAIVVMQPHPDSGQNRLEDVEISLIPTPDGQWWVGSLNYPHLIGRG